jgi:dihydroneopterin aldolase
MLASVTGPEEAKLALAGGADIIDLKDPRLGALGAVTADTIRRTVGVVGGRRAVSAVAGDLPMDPDVVSATARAIAACAVDYVKLGIFPGGDALGCIRALRPLAASVKLIAVFFGDAAPELSLVPALAGCGFAGAMIDTMGKSSGSLLSHASLSELHGFVEQCHAAGLIAGLAGSLEKPDIPRLLVLRPDLLGFRGALCGPGGRTAGLDPSAVQAVRALIPVEGRTPDTPDVDYRLLSARGYSPLAAGADVAVDRVFVEDFVLPIYIGAYSKEFAAPQRVRFAVDAFVMRGNRTAQDIGDVFSYDLITDGIRMLTDAGHVGLVETLAERIASMVLAYPRVMKVMVRVEKLDTGLGAVGVEIERTRPASRPLGRAVAALAPEPSVAGAEP